MARWESNSVSARAFSLLSAFVVVAALYFAREVLLPIALAVLFSFLLAPLADRLERWGCHRVLSVLIAVSLLFAGIGGLGYILTRQLYDLAYNLPEYKFNVIEKVRSFQSDPDGAVGRATRALQEVKENLDPKADETAAVRTQKKEPGNSTSTAADRKEYDPNAEDGNNNQSVALEVHEPVPVRVIDEFPINGMIDSVLTPALSVLGMAAMVVVFVIFILLEREDLRNRMVYLAGAQRLTQTTEVLDDAARRVSHYLVMQCILNAAYGVVTAIGLYFIGLPNALLWGALAGMMRFLPYIGPWLGALMPLAVSLAVFDGWTRPLLVLALFLVNELVSNNVLEPWLYGSSTGISSIGILISAVFWTWLWGPIGLVMATPLTVCLTSLGRFVPALSFIRTLISTEEKLPLAARVYQRLLALDAEEAIDLTDEFLKTHTPCELYDEVLMPVLSHTEQDRHRGNLDDEKARAICQTLRELIDDVGNKAAKKSAEQLAELPAESGPVSSNASIAPLLCVPARDEADEIAGLMLAQISRERGLDLRVLSTTNLSAEVLEQIDVHTAPIVCVSALPPQAATHARYLCKRLRSRFAKLKIVVALWESGGSTRTARDRLADAGVDKFVTSISDAVELLESYSSQAVIQSIADGGAAAPDESTVSVST